MAAALRASKKIIHVLMSLLSTGPFAATIKRHKAVNEAEVSLPGPDQFREVLGQECASASDTHSHLAVLLLRLPNWSPERKEELARLLLAITRRDKALFSVSESCFALLLRGMDAACGAAFSLQILNLLRRYFDDEFFSFDLLAYPERARNLAELETELLAAIG